ncbi:O-antigen ligase family protein [Coleofasciculus sp. E2-BRE-01]|uniref:O-antigen ligase family protein n=1 Tax=Coleofasciculus sp. E2-BRE-01 TaxID=3069524 RepID=UPI004062C04B
MVILILLGLLGVKAHPLIDKALLAASYFILPVLIMGRWKKWIYAATLDIPVLLLSLMPTVSAIWSTSAVDTIDFSKGVIRASLLGIYLATSYSLKGQMQIFTWVFGIGTVLSLVLTPSLPGYGRVGSGEWIGIYAYKNHAALMMALAAILFLLKALNQQQKNWIYWTLFSTAIVQLVLTEGKTCYAIFANSLFLLPLYNSVKQNHYKMRIFLVLIISLLLGTSTVLLFQNLEFIIVDTLGKDMDLNGRTAIWTLVMDKVHERPWLGYGASGFWGSKHALYVIYHTWAASVEHIGISPGQTKFNAHSGYLDFLLQYGFVGSSLMIYSYITIILRLVAILAATAKIETFWMMQTLVAILFVNVTERLGLIGYDTLWTIHVAIALSTALEQKRLQTPN